jgi:hypothetical protein
MDVDELRAIRMRHHYWMNGHGDAAMAATDRAKLLDEVDRLGAQLSESRAAYDALCRQIGRTARERS